MSIDMGNPGRGVNVRALVERGDLLVFVGF